MNSSEQHRLYWLFERIPQAAGYHERVHTFQLDIQRRYVQKHRLQVDRGWPVPEDIDGNGFILECLYSYWKMAPTMHQLFELPNSQQELSR